MHARHQVAQMSAVKAQFLAVVVSHASVYFDHVMQLWTDFCINVAAQMAHGWTLFDLASKAFVQELLQNIAS